MIIICNKSGQLGNRLFVFANAIGYGVEHGHTVFDPALDEYAEHFESTHDRLLPCFPPRGPRASDRSKLRGLIARAVRLITGPLFGRDPLFGGRVRAITAGEPFRSLGEALNGGRRPLVVLQRRYILENREEFRAHADAIKSFLRPRNALVGRAREAAMQARRGNRRLVGVHMRHGDYREFRQGAFFFDAAQYRAWIEEIRSTFSDDDPTFLLCSDEPQDPTAFGGLPVTFSRLGPVEELFALSFCDLIVGPPSSFSLWASFYGGVPILRLRNAEQRVRAADVEDFPFTTAF